MGNVATIRAIYEEVFGRQDIEAVIRRMAPDVRWEHHPTGNAAQERGVPYLRRRTGRDEIAGFFRELGDHIEMRAFEPRAFLEGDGYVAVLIEYELTVRSTGAKVHDEEMHLWQFAPDGTITAHRGFLDTAKAIAAHAGSPQQSAHGSTV